MQSEREDEHAADEPHGPGSAADSCGAALTPEVDDLGHVGGDRYRDPEEPKDLKHNASFIESDCSLLRRRASRWRTARSLRHLRDPRRPRSASTLSFAAVARFRDTGLAS